jgi:DNA polymerase-3 subunit alpha
MALGGFTGPEADTLGYAIRKKKSSVLRAQKEKFVRQAAERGVEPAVIDAVFKAFEPFERYGFNKAHATCYGLVAYQTAYLKANFTVEYMSAVLSAFRDNGEKVAAAVAECRRMGIDVLPPDVHRSGLEFTVEGGSIRFGLLAVKNVGEGAIESIIAAREEGGPFRSLTDFCSRIDLRLANRKVLESLARGGAMNAFGHPAQVLAGLDDATAVAQATQRDRLTGQTSLFDLAVSEDAVSLEKPLPDVTEEPTRVRLRWEKELLGLYLSEHPMGEVAEQVGAYVNAYSGDLKDESLDGQRVVIGGIVTGVRTVVTKARQTMAVATLEDLQGAVEVVVFPRTYEQTQATWQEGAILLVAGRIDHRGEDVSLLADLVTEWDAAVARGPETFAREVAAGDRGGRRRGPNGNGSNGRSTYGSNGSNGALGPNGHPRTPQAPVAAAAAGSPPAVPWVSPLRAEARPSNADALGVLAPSVPRPTVSTSLPPLPPAEPVVAYGDAAGLPGADDPDEPPLPDEARRAIADAARAPTEPLDAGPDRVLHVRFARAAGTDRLVQAMEAVRAVLRSRPGATKVVLHLPSNGGDSLPMELRNGIAYDAELLAEVDRRIGRGLVELQLA